MTPLGVAILMLVLGAAIALYGGWLLIEGKYRHTGLGLLWGGAAVAFVAAVAQPHTLPQEPADTSTISGPAALAWPCMDGSTSGDCLTHDERVDRAHMIAKALKEASGPDKLRDMVCASSPTMLICVEVPPSRPTVPPTPSN